MDQKMITFLALLAVLCTVFLVFAIPFGIYLLIAKKVPAPLVPIRDALADGGLFLAAAVAVVATLGSLYLSEFANFVPCELCWFQRIFMYPLSVILTIAAFRRDVSIRIYAIPLALIGAAISTYHYLVERFPDQVSFECNTEVPCSVTLVWKFHYLSIPGMAWLGFLTIAVLLAYSRPKSAGGSSGHQRESVDPNAWAESESALSS
jgi:disulfide bond formation protein DsbB